MPEFRMPSLGADMDAGTIIEWLVKPGDEVHRGDIVAVVDTDKADVDVEIFADGVVDEILVPPGEKVDVGTPLASILAPGETVREASTGGPRRPQPPRRRRPRRRGQRRRASRLPSARRAAARRRRRRPRQGPRPPSPPTRPWSVAWRGTSASTSPASRARGPVAR